MKNILIAAASMAGIIAIRMILSVALSEQAADIFTKASVTFLFFFFILLFAKNRKNSKNE